MEYLEETLVVYKYAAYRYAHKYTYRLTYWMKSNFSGNTKLI